MGWGHGVGSLLTCVGLAVGLVGLSVPAQAARPPAGAAPTATGVTAAAALVVLSPTSKTAPVPQAAKRKATTRKARKSPASKPSRKPARKAATARRAPAPPANKTGRVHAGSLRTWEWRRLDRTPVSQLTAGFGKFRALGGTTVALDLSYVVDISEIAGAPARKAARQSYNQRLRQYVEAASRAGLTVEAAAGSPHWIRPDVRYVFGIVSEFITSFNAAAPAGQRLTGLHLDLEPWGTAEWRTKAPTLTRQLLDTVAAIAAQQKATPAASRVPVSVDLPFWLDGTTAPKAVSHSGRTASPTEHVMRLLDNGAGQANSVVIMAYRDTAGGVDGSIAVSAREMTLAKQFAGRVLVTMGQEVGRVEPQRTTFFEEGLDALLAAMGTLRSTFGSGTGFGGFAIDDMAGLERLT